LGWEGRSTKELFGKARQEKKGKKFHCGKRTEEEKGCGTQSSIEVKKVFEGASRPVWALREGQKLGHSTEEVGIRSNVNLSRWPVMIKVRAVDTLTT